MVLALALAPAAFAAGPSSPLVPARDRSGCVNASRAAGWSSCPVPAADRSGFATNLRSLDISIAPYALRVRSSVGRNKRSALRRFSRRLQEIATLSNPNGGGMGCTLDDNGNKDSCTIW